MVPLGRGYTHYASILRTLRRITPPDAGGGSDLRSCVSRIRRHSPVFVISDFFTADRMQDGLDALSIRGDRLHALQIVSSLEYQVPEENQVRFRDVETARTITVDLGDTERENYRIALDRFCDSLADYCRKQRIRFSHHMNDENWKSVLAAHLLQGNRQP
jgi:hypothetical protein